MNKVLFPGKNDYQDHRAILVYLSMKYPDKYYLYKFGMFEEFVKLVDYPSKPIAGRVDNVIHFIKLCNHLKAEILLDEELLEQHLARLTEKDYPDTEYNILTQDIIYAAVEHLDIFDQPQEQESAFIRLKKVFKKVVAKSDRVSLKGHKSDHEETEKEKRRIGYLGELLVLQHEQTSLLDKGISKVPIHKSITEGDGLGYDILSYNSKGEEIYIEVKTTKYDADTPFYITANELEKSKEVGNRFCLYRLYFFDDMNNCAVYYDRSGDLTDLCINPILYKVVVESTDEG